MALTISPGQGHRVLMQVIAPDGTRLTVSLTSDEARRAATDLDHYATVVEPYGARANIGTVVAINGRGVE